MKKKMIAALLLAMTLSSLSGCGAMKQVGGAVNQELNQTESTTETTTEQGTTEAATQASLELLENIEIEEEKKLKNLDLSQYMTLPDLSKMEVKVAEVPVTDESIKTYIDTNIITSIEVTDRAIANGDVANIDFVGKKDGVAFDNGSGNGYNLGIGSGTFIPGFEEGLIGVKPGETVDVDVTFPEDYPQADLAGQPVVFTVTVHSIVETATYDTVTPEQLASMNLSYKTKEEVWEAAKKECEKEAEETFNSNASYAIYDEISKNTEFKEVPDQLMESFKIYYTNYMMTMIYQNTGMTLDDYIVSVGQTREQFDTDVAGISEEAVKQDMIFEAIADQEGVDITEDELKKFAEEDAKQYNYESADAFLENVGNDRYRQNKIQDLVTDLLADKVKVVKTAPEEVEMTTEAETQKAE